MVRGSWFVARGSWLVVRWGDDCRGDSPHRNSDPRLLQLLQASLRSEVPQQPYPPTSEARSRRRRCQSGVQPTAQRPVGRDRKPPLYWLLRCWLLVAGTLRPQAAGTVPIAIPPRAAWCLGSRLFHQILDGAGQRAGDGGQCRGGGLVDVLHSLLVQLDVPNVDAGGACKTGLREAGRPAQPP